MGADENAWTTCTTPDNVISFNQYLSTSLTTGVFGAIMVGIAIAAGDPLCIAFAALATAIVWILIYCDWWLNWRLVCLGDGSPVSVVGMVINIEPPSDKSWPNSLDSDYSLNLMLPNSHFGDSQATVWGSAPFGHLMAENPTTASHGLLFTGNEATDKQTGKSCEALHVELEGASIHDLQLVNTLALIAALAALALCLSGIGIVVAIILAALAFLAFLFSSIFSSSDTADPSDAGLPSVETNDASGKGAHIVGVTGRWVYDAGHIHDSYHEGHNELHPVQQAQILGTWDGDWPLNIDDIIRDYQTGIANSRSPLTQDRQSRPESQWKIHPLIDGCRRADEPPSDTPPDIK